MAEKQITVSLKEEELKHIISSLQKDENVSLYLRAEEGGEKYALLMKFLEYFKDKEANEDEH
jgi:hypothetical protein